MFLLLVFGCDCDCDVNLMLPFKINHLNFYYDTTLEVECIKSYFLIDKHYLNASFKGKDSTIKQSIISFLKVIKSPTCFLTLS